MKRILLAIDIALWKTTAALTGVVVLSMVGLSFIQVVMRLAFNSGLLWADGILTHLVLWLSLLGGILATRQGRQISIDLLTRIPNPTVRTAFTWIGGLFTIVICVLLAKGSMAFLEMQQQIGGMLTGTQIPSWWAAVILPAGFAVIAVQGLLNLALGRKNGIGVEVEVVVEQPVDETVKEAPPEKPKQEDDTP